MSHSTQKIFDNQCSLMNFDFIKANIPYVSDVELIPVNIDDSGDVEWTYDDNTANAFSVYFRYNKEAVRDKHLNPSEWLADFDTREAAEKFQSLIKTILIINLIH